nr:uncharacterized protein LOC109186548 isoform X2 [Ipomoea batatas]
MEWEKGERRLPDGIIFVEELCGPDGEVEDDDEGETKIWGIVVQGRGAGAGGDGSGGPICYLLKTTVIMVGERRDSMEVEERSELRHKRVKMRDLESVFRSEERNGRDAIANHGQKALDLNATLGSSCNGVSAADIAADVDRRDREAPFKFRRFGLDLNKEVVSSSLNHDPFYPSKDGENAESRDEFDCASSFAPLEGKDSSFRAWNEMKQNGFCSYSHGRKSRNEGMERRR